MSASNRFSRAVVVAASAGAMFFSTANLTRAFAGAHSGLSLTSTASELSSILGTDVTIHVTAEAANSKTLPIVCKALVDAVADVIREVDDKARIGRLMDVVVIDGRRPAMHENFVALKNHVLIIQTINDPSDAADLRALVSDVLKKFIQPDEKMELAR